MGLLVNISKTDVVCQWSPSTPRTLPVFTIDHRPLTITPSFKYLGSRLSASPPSSTAVKHGPHIAGISSPMEHFHIGWLQRILDLTWCDRVPHTEIQIGATITQHQVRWSDMWSGCPKTDCPHSAVRPVTPRLALGRRAKEEVYGLAENLTEEVQNQAWGSRDCCCWQLGSAA